MAKKCMSGFLCVRTATITLFIAIGLVAFGLVSYFSRDIHRFSSPFMVASSQPSLSDPYVPPLNKDPSILPIRSHSAVPVNIPTQGDPGEYRQMGILTKMSAYGEKMILPLMGRALQTGRDKWQYYTMSNTPGAYSTRLPISVNGRSGTSEYGTDSVSNGDVVYVEGYDDTFKTTLYENGLLRYIPL